MRWRASGFCVLLALLLPAGGGQTAPGPAGPRALDARASVTCRALEVQTDGAKRTTLVVFHHAADADRPALAQFLREHSGADVEIVQAGSQAAAVPGTVFRLKSCFGRGLLLLPPSAGLKEGAVFFLRLPELRAAAVSPHHE